MLYGLYQALALVIEEGETVVHARHAAMHERLVAGLAQLGLSMLVDAPYRLPMLNAVRIPDGANDAEVRTRLLTDYRIEIGGGLGPLAGKIWRIGLMGHTARAQNVDRVLAALRAVLR